MAPTVYLSCLLALSVAGLAQGVKGSLRNQDPGPQPLELKQVFTLFQIQYNRSYSNPEVTPPSDPLLVFPVGRQRCPLIAFGENPTLEGLGSHFLGPDVCSGACGGHKKGATAHLEYARRLDIFARNLAQAQQLEAEDLGTAEFGVTPFSDLTEEEFGQLYGHRRMVGEAPSVGRKVGSEESGESMPPRCDWRKLKGVISPIKRQENCNCCWAMAVAGNVEALWGIRYNRSVQVSVQELLDCGRCGDGCRGGFVWDAFITVLNNSGLASEQDYPFRGNSKPHKCLAKNYKKVAWIQDFIMLEDNEQRIAWYLATQGPITVTINMKLLQQYQKGVIKATPATCDPQLVDHSVLLVGFGKSKSVAGRRAEAGSSQPHRRNPIPYWILKNSWGAEWGEKGYFRLHRGSNTCGITKYPLTARVDLPAKKRPVSCPH